MAMVEKKKPQKRSFLRAVVESGGQAEKPKYNPRDFIIPTSDSKGHSVPMGFRCMSGYMRDVDVIVSARKFPYRTASDLMRHALHNHLHMLTELEPKIPVRLSILDTAVELARTQQMLLKYQSTVREVANTIDQLTREGLPGEARKLVKDIMVSIEDDPVDDEWKRRLKKEIFDKYSYLFPSGVVVDD